MLKPKLIALILISALTAGAQLAPPPAVPRKSPDFFISNPSDPSGKAALLSSLKGKVVVLAFLFVQSDHCLKVARTLDKLNSELRSRGFQASVIVFDPPKVRPSNGGLIQPWVNYFKLTLPVGFATKDQVDTYLGRTGNELLAIPQIVVIDRAGMIRAASGARVDPTLEDENSLRTLLDPLLKESPPAGAPSRQPPAGSNKKAR